MELEKREPRLYILSPMVKLSVNIIRSSITLPNIFRKVKEIGIGIPMFLLAYRSSRHEPTGVTLAELYLGKDLRLPLDLSIGNPPNTELRTVDEYIDSLKESLKKIRAGARNLMEIRSSWMKAWYDRKARDLLFQERQKVWLLNPRRKLGRAPKLQSDWEGPYLIVRKMSDVIFCIRSTPTHRKKVVHADRLAPFLERK